MSDHHSIEVAPKTFHRVLQTFRPHLWWCLLIVLTTLALAASGTLSPIIMGLIIDRAFPHKDLPLLMLLTLVLVLMPVITGLISIGRDYANTTIGQRVMHDLRVTLYAHLQAVSMRFYTVERTGEILSRFTNDINGIQTIVTTTLSVTLLNSMTVLSTFVVMVRLNVPLTTLSFGLVPLFLFLTYRVGVVRRRVSKLTQQRMADLSSILEETVNVSGALLVKSFGHQRTQTQRFTEASKRLEMTQIHQTMLGRWFFLIFHIFFAVAPALVYYIGGLQVIGGTLSLGSLVAFTALQSILFRPLGDLLTTHVDLQGALALFDRIFEYLDFPIEKRDRPDAEALEHIEGHIRFRQVSFRFYPDRSTLMDIDFEVQPGQLVALVGPSGAGKTTLTYLLTGLYDAEQGAVEIDGQNIRHVARESLARHIGMVVQESYLLNATIRDNILYGRADASEEEMITAARVAQIHERILELPNGYDTMVGPRGFLLSGGEKQRVAIARVLLKNPRIFILDEATSALDTHSERLIQMALAQVQVGRTTLAIAHRLSTILSADLILVMDGGRIVERGTQRELLERGGLYARFYSEQFGDSAEEQRRDEAAQSNPTSMR